ncbi:hypothetical protein [Vibrio hibernica]|uniref:hypothetical protein n=1 Tax=Vibrio hibernica TaxID=2587465 RepID=UPI0039AEDE5B
MDWKTFIVEITRAIAWPLIIVAFFCVFKVQIQELFKNISELKFGKASAVFGKQILANKVSQHEKTESEKQETTSSRLTKEDIYNIPDDDYVFMQEISANEEFMPVNEKQSFKYNSLVNHGYFTQEKAGCYKPTKLGGEILAALKSI